ncbi:MAG: hypothetical protein DMF54_02220 [Acidobacteria bacterium]|nr:MAG: hypothetical protein DMF54_02220 [Acidobacteriota bacterium]
MKIRAGSLLVTGLAVLFLAAGSPAFGAAKAKGEKVDLNSASQSELEALPGVGAATARKIIENRPYSSVSGLSKAGVSEATIAKIRGLVKAGRTTMTSAEKKEEKAAVKQEKRETKREKTAEKAAIKSGEKVDVNSASQGELEALPGVGAATAKKIMANRPYSSLADLSRAGVSASTMDKIRDKVKVGGRPRGRRKGPRAASRRLPPERSGRRLPPERESRSRPSPTRRRRRRGWSG